MINIVYEMFQKIFGEGGISKVALGRGVGKGEDGWKVALEQALKSNDIGGATRAVAFISTGNDTKLYHIEQCVNQLKTNFDDENLYIEFDILDDISDDFQIVIIATGFPQD